GYQLTKRPGHHPRYACLTSRPTTCADDDHLSRLVTINITQFAQKSRGKTQDIEKIPAVERDAEGLPGAAGKENRARHNRVRPDAN
ncbi:MAG: hypothetical protein PHI35_09380, partial [Victivallaceae bacterium]|nr:hypothetical protein [Victivallaceae bacterium]